MPSHTMVMSSATFQASRWAAVDDGGKKKAIQSKPSDLGPLYLIRLLGLGADSNTCWGEVLVSPMGVIPQSGGNLGSYRYVNRKGLKRKVSRQVMEAKSVRNVGRSK